MFAGIAFRGMEQKLCVVVGSPCKMSSDDGIVTLYGCLPLLPHPAATWRRRNKLWKGGRFDDYVQLKTSTLGRGVNDCRCLFSEYSKLEFTFTAGNEFVDDLSWTWAALPITYLRHTRRPTCDDNRITLQNPLNGAKFSDYFVQHFHVAPSSGVRQF